ncbi:MULTISPECIES: hypothetical protein [Acetobacter]|uniref:hypothetical protein n=1 Tax=Acetobacter TaxID=434 RepID=UPI00376F52CA
MTQPTGVFVRLPLNEEQVESVLNSYVGDKESTNICMQKTILELGTPVTGGKLKIVGYAPSHLEGGWCAIFRKKSDALKSSIPLVRQSDAQAQIAALEAEVVRLREALEGIENGLPEDEYYWIVAEGLLRSIDSGEVVPLPNVGGQS